MNPIDPDIKMHILLTVLHTFLTELVRRICLNIKSSYPRTSNDNVKRISFSSLLGPKGLTIYITGG